MSGFELFDGDTKMRITNGSRTVFTTDGTLINLLPPAYDLNTTLTVAFPDIVKDFQYNWRHGFDYTALGDRVAFDSFCVCNLTARPQEYEVESTIVAAPPGADIFVGRLSLARTLAPTHSWNGVAIQPKQPMGVHIPFVSGSLLIEAEVGIARAFSIFVSGGNLRLNIEQSVCTAPGGWGLYGTAFHHISNPNDGGGGENVYGAAPGIPIIQVSTVNVAAVSMDADLFSWNWDQRTRYGVGANQCPLPNYASYNYSSTYQVNLTGSFGRRS
ncbi:hypothetical protein [Devosia riboflavina]